MRIALDTQSTLGHKTGIGLYTASLLPALRQVRPQHEYVELAWGRTEELRTDQRLWWQQVGLPRRARSADADVLHVTGFDAPLWRPCPTVLTVHDLIGFLFPGNLPPISRLYWARWLPRTIRWADRVIADSEHTRRDLIRLLEIPPGDIEVVHLGVERRFRPLEDQASLEAVRRNNGLPPEIILYVGTIEPRKGLDTLIAAYGTLASEISHKLVIAGKRGWYTEPLFKQVEALGLGKRVHFTDYVADEDLPWLYNLADLFAFPSRYEGFGLPPLEAMACGVPVVCSNAASLPEVAGQAAVLVQPDDVEGLATAMLRVLRDSALQAEMRARGLERARLFTWDEAARRTAAVYEGVR
jgi:glycosyltransferase involved in cell wall biosynthesis